MASTFESLEPIVGADLERAIESAFERVSQCSDAHPTQLLRLHSFAAEIVERTFKRLAPLYNEKAPIARLPAELLTKIFAYLKPIERIDATHVSSLWRAIALDSPALLWSELPPVRDADLASMLLERAGEAVVDIPQLRIFLEEDPLLSVVHSHMHHIRGLHIRVYKPTLLLSKQRALSAILYTAAPTLEYFSISHPDSSPPAALPLDKRPLFAEVAPQLRTLAFNTVVAPLKFYRALPQPSSVNTLTVGGPKIVIAMGVIAERSQILPGLQTLNVEVLRLKESTVTITFPPSLRRVNIHYTGTNALEAFGELLMEPEFARLDTIHVSHARTGWRRNVTETAIPGSGSPYTRLEIPAPSDRDSIDLSLVDQDDRRRYFVGIDPRHATEILPNDLARSLTTLVVGTSALALRIIGDVEFPALQALQWVLLDDSAAFVHFIYEQEHLPADTPALARIEFATNGSSSWPTALIAQLLQLQESYTQTVREVVFYGLEPDIEALVHEVTWVEARVRFERQWPVPDSSWYNQAPFTFE